MRRVLDVDFGLVLRENSPRIETEPKLVLELERRADRATLTSRCRGQGVGPRASRSSARDGRELGVCSGSSTSFGSVSCAASSPGVPARSRVETRRIVGVEALVRWNSPSAGSSSPTSSPGGRGDGRDHPARRLRAARGLRPDRALEREGLLLGLRHLGQHLRQAAHVRRSGDSGRACTARERLSRGCRFEVTETRSFVDGTSATGPARI